MRNRKFWLYLAGALQAAAQVYSSSELLLNRDGQSQSYSGIGKFRGNCTAFFIATRGPDTAPAYVVTSGHCIDWSTNAVILGLPLPPVPVPGGGILGMTFGYFVDTQDRQFTVATRRVAYSTMKGVDVAVIELAATTRQLVEAGYRPLEIATEAAAAREPVVVGAPYYRTPDDSFLRLASCAAGKGVNLIEFIWHWWDSYSNDCPDLKPGSSGSPMISGRSGKVVAVVNTGTEGSYACGGDFDCYLNIPCEVTTEGARVADDTNYAAPIHGLGRCFDSSGSFDVNLPGCPLDNGRQLTLSSPLGRTTRPPATWKVTLASDTLTHYRYKIVAEGRGDCRSEDGYGPVIGLRDSNLINDVIGQADGRYYLCVLGGDETWQPPRWASVIHVKIDSAPPVVPLRYWLRSSGADYTLSFLFDSPEIDSVEHKVGKPSGIRCDDPGGYLPWSGDAPLNLAKAEGPFRVCALGRDEAGNPTPPLDILLDGTQILPNGVVNAASYALGTVAPGEWVSAYGIGFPQEVAVYVTDSSGARWPAPTQLVAPEQINLLIPLQTAMGPATLTVNDATTCLQVEAVAPGLFAAGYLLRVRVDGSRSYEPVFPAATPEVGPDSDALYLELYGTGIRAGRQVSARIGRQPVGILYAGPIANVEGVDQVNVRLPSPFRLRGYQALMLTVDGKTANRLPLFFR